MFLASAVISLIPGAILPGFDTVTLLEVLLPLSFIACTVEMDIDTVAISLIVDPLPVEYIAIDMMELAFTMCFVVFPISFILGAIGPGLNAVPVTHIA